MENNICLVCENRNRTEDIYLRRQKGETYKSISNLYGVSQDRCRALYARHCEKIETSDRVTELWKLNNAVNSLRERIGFLQYSVDVKIGGNSSSEIEVDIEELELNVRAQNALKSCEVFTINDLINKSEEDLLNAPRIGKKSLNEIKDTLRLKFGMKLKIKKGETNA